MRHRILTHWAVRTLGAFSLASFAIAGILPEEVKWNPEPGIEVDLEQQASELGLPVEQLARARESLVRATRVELTDLLSRDDYEPRALVRAWERLHPRGVDSMIRFRTKRLPDTWDSTGAIEEIISLLSPLVDTDPPRLRRLLSARVPDDEERRGLLNRIVQHRWKTRTGEGAATSNDIEDLLARSERIYPEVDMLFEIRGLQVRQLWIENRVAEGRRVAEAIVEEFEQRSEVSDWLVEDFGKALRWMGRFTPEVFATGFGLLERVLDRAGGKQSGEKRLLAKDGSGFVPVSWANRIRIDTLVGVHSRKTLWRRVLSDRPELRELVGRVHLKGGWLYSQPIPYGLPRDEESRMKAERTVSQLLDRSYRVARRASGSPAMMHSSINFNRSGGEFGPPLPNRVKQGRTSPSWRSTRSELARELGTLDHFDLLFRYASSNALKDKYRREALEIARGLLDEAEEPVLRARLLTGILPLERRFGDAASRANHLAEARTLLDELRKSPPSNIGGAGPEGIQWAIDAFERVVVAEWAWIDFPGAMSYAASLSGFQQYAVYLDITRLLSQSPYYRNWPTP